MIFKNTKVCVKIYSQCLANVDLKRHCSSMATIKCELFRNLCHKDYGGKSVVVWAFLVWIVLLLSFSRGSNTCDDANTFQDWVLYFNFAEFCMFFKNFFVQMFAVVQSDRRIGKYSALLTIKLAAIAIYFIAGSCSFIQYVSPLPTCTHIKR